MTLSTLKPRLQASMCVACVDRKLREKRLEAVVRWEVSARSELDIPEKGPQVEDQVQELALDDLPGIKAPDSISLSL